MDIASFSHGDLCNILCSVGHSYSNFTLFHPHCHFQWVRQFAFRITALNSNQPHLNPINGSFVPLGWSGHSLAGHQRPTKLWGWPTPPTSSPTTPLSLYAPNHLQSSKASSYNMTSYLHMCMTPSEMPMFAFKIQLKSLFLGDAGLNPPTLTPTTVNHFLLWATAFLCTYMSYHTTL